MRLGTVRATGEATETRGRGSASGRGRGSHGTGCAFATPQNARRCIHVDASTCISTMERGAHQGMVREGGPAEDTARAVEARGRDIAGICQAVAAP